MIVAGNNGEYAFIVLVCCVAIAASVAAQAHEFWVGPTNFHPSRGETVGLKIYQGKNFKGQSLPYIDEWFTRFVVRTPAGLADVDGELGDDPAGTVLVDNPGFYIVAYQSTADFLELDALRFNRFLHNEGLDQVARTRAERGESDRPGREYYWRCAKTLFGTDLAQAAGFDQSLDCLFELIPETNPYAAEPSARLRVQALYLGEPIAGILVRGFTNAEAAQPIEARTDENGRAELYLYPPGYWLLNAVHMVPAIDREDAQWESFWASITFDTGTQP